MLLIVAHLYAREVGAEAHSCVGWLRVECDEGKKKEELAERRGESLISIVE